jgi:hypothetical protein
MVSLKLGLCGDKVTKAVVRILAGEDSPEIVNKTFIVMIPKIVSPKEMGQFHPISLCNVLYIRLPRRWLRID